MSEIVQLESGAAPPDLGISKREGKMVKTYIEFDDEEYAIGALEPTEIKALVELIETFQITRDGKHHWLQSTGFESKGSQIVFVIHMASECPQEG